MSACSDKLLLLHGLLDGELDAANTMACEAHLSTCAACAAEYERLQALRGRIGLAAKLEAPAHLRMRVLAALRAAEADAMPKRSARRALPAFLPWVFGGSMAAAVAVLAFVLLVRLPGPGVAGELVEAHVRSLLAAHLTDVAASDRHVVKPWFAGKVNFAPPVLELAEQGFPLAGGRIDYLNGRVVAALVYRRHQHIINVFVWPAAETGNTGLAELRRDGYNILGWRRGGLQFWAVSDVEAAELRQLRAAFIAGAAD